MEQVRTCQVPEEIFKKENIGGFGREGSIPAGSWMGGVSGEGGIWRKPDGWEGFGHGGAGGPAAGRNRLSTSREQQGLPLGWIRR